MTPQELGTAAGIRAKLENFDFDLSFEITSFNLPEISFNVTCSKGTYIRSLAHDFGKELNSGAHLSELRRINIGDYSVKDSVKVMDFIRAI